MKSWERHCLYASTSSWKSVKEHLVTKCRCVATIQDPHDRVAPYVQLMSFNADMMYERTRKCN